MASRELRRRTDDPLAAVLALGERTAKIAAIVALILALIPHGVASAKAVSSLFKMRHFVELSEAKLHDYFWTLYDIDTVKKPDEAKPPEPPEPPPPEPEPKAIPVAKAPDEPYEPDKSPPKPSQASKVLADDKPVVDMTGNQWGIVSGEGNALGGQQSADGQGNKVVKNAAASNTGVAGGTGTVATAAPAIQVGPDRSAAPSVAGSTSWNCPFPPEADADQVDQAVVSIMVTVRGDGSPAAVKVLSDPGHGFGRAARSCALTHHFNVGKDRDGNAITASTPPFNVRFTR